MAAGQAFFKLESVLERSLDAQSLRLRTTAHNVANANTPGFKRSAVRFESALRQELAPGGGRLPLWATRPGHISRRGGVGSGAVPEIVVERHTSMRNDGNNVDPEREMAELARTQLTYQALTRVMNERYRRVRNVIQQGGR